MHLNDTFYMNNFAHKETFTLSQVISSLSVLSRSSDSSNIYLIIQMKEMVCMQGHWDVMSSAARYIWLRFSTATMFP